LNNIDLTLKFSFRFSAESSSSESIVEDNDDDDGGDQPQPNGEEVFHVDVIRRRLQAFARRVQESSAVFLSSVLSCLIREVLSNANNRRRYIQSR
jgi:hypothetical protein